MAEDFVQYQDIRIEDVDYAVRDWLNLRVDAWAEAPGEELRKVPVVFASGERWATARDQRGIRDSNGVLILPLISVRRTGIAPTRDRVALGVEQHGITIARRVDEKTHVVQNAISSRELPNRRKRGRVVYELTTMPFPDVSVVTYEVMIWTQFISQMNTVLEKVFDSYDIQKSFVMPVRTSKFEQGPEREEDRPFDERRPLRGYYFVGFADTDASDSGNFEEFTDQERIVRYSFHIEVPAYLQLDPQGKRPAITRSRTAFDISFGREEACFVDDLDELDDVFAYKKPPF